MNMKKILAAASASVLAVSAVSVMAFAADGGSYFVGAADGWTTSNESGLPEGLTMDQLKAHKTITFTATGCDEWGIGVDKTAGWYQTNTDEGAFQKNGSITLNTADLNLEKSDFCLKICINKATKDDAEVKWEFDAAATTSGATSTATSAATSTATSAATSTATSGTTSKAPVNTGVEGVAAVLGVAVVAAGAMVVAKKRK